MTAWDGRQAGLFVGDEGRRLRRDGADESKLAESAALTVFGAVRCLDDTKQFFICPVAAGILTWRKLGQTAGQRLSGKSRFYDERKR